ncbi:MAG TPA: hypothetical protein VN380_10275 [Thermoanaerobaculia bacterium]|jgi:UDP-N-acetylmuramate dehydrogenase|nr:hypothetical protein [Thermoanaerobaculia bacterium]
MELPSTCPDVYLVSDPEELRTFICALGPARRNMLQIAGELSNTVLSETLPGPLVLFRDGDVSDISTEDDCIIVRAAGSCRFDRLVQLLCELGIPGVELLSGIPGTLGAGIVQNIAAYGQRLSDRFLSARTLDLESGAIVHMNPIDMTFSYRSSALKDPQSYTPKRIILDAVLQFPKTWYPEPLKYEDIRQLHLRRSRSIDDILSRRLTVLEVRQRKGMVVGGENWMPSAGSFFVSPIVPEETALHIATLVRGSQFAQRFLSWYQPGVGEIRCPAALLMRASGFLNGDRWGPVGLSPHHILAICTYSSATASDVAAVAALVQARVQAMVGIPLQTEVRYAGSIANPDVETFLSQNPFLPGCEEPPWVLGLSTTPMS